MLVNCAGPALPATCAPGDRFRLDAHPYGFYHCDTTDVWTQDGPASAPGSIPSGLICMWSGLLVNIPTGWLICDGLNGTPDLRAVFIKGAAAGVDPGVTGGAATHTHDVTSNVAVANHTFTQPTVAWPAGVPTFAGTALGTHTHTFTGNAVAAASNTTTAKLYTANTSTGVTAVTTATGTNASVSAGTPAGTVAWPAAVPTNSGGAVNAHAVTNNLVTSAAASSEPAYYSLAFIMKS